MSTRQMSRLLKRIMILMSVAVVMASCGLTRPVSSGTGAKNAEEASAKSISHNDSLRFKMFFLEAIRQDLEGNYAEAYDLLRHSLAINPLAAEAYFMLCGYDEEISGSELALKDIKTAAELSPGNNSYIERLGQMYVVLDNLVDAADTYEKVISNNPKRSEILGVLIRIYLRLRDYDKAIETIERFEALEGDSEQTALMKMSAYSLQGKRQEELNVLKALAAKYPNELNYKVMIANWLLNNGESDMAYQEYLDVLRQEPENTFARMSLIDYYEQSGGKAAADSMRFEMLVSDNTPTDSKVSIMRQVIMDNEKNGKDSSEVMNLFRKVLSRPQKTADMAEMLVVYMSMNDMPRDSISPVYEMILDIAPDNVGARLEVIHDVWMNKDFARMEKLSLEGISYTPDELLFYYFLGMAYIQQDEDERALEALREGIKQVKEDSTPSLVSDFYALMGDLLHSMDQHKLAYEAYDNCLKWKEDNVGCLNNYAYFLSEDGSDLSKAERMSLRAVQSEPLNSLYLDTYAWILFKMKNYDDALQYIDMALENDKDDNAVIIEHAGDINAVMGNVDKAVEYWKRALELGDGEDKTLIKKIKLRKYVDDK